MRVTITSDDCAVQVEADGLYSPDVMLDLSNRAVETYTRAFVDDTTGDEP